MIVWNLGFLSHKIRLASINRSTMVSNNNRIQTYSKTVLSETWKMEKYY